MRFDEAAGGLALGQGPLGFIGSRYLMGEAENAIPEGRGSYLTPQQRELEDRVQRNAINARADTEQGINEAIDRSQNAFGGYDVKASGALTNRYRSAMQQKLNAVRAQNATKGFAAGQKALGQATQMANQRLEIENQNLQRVRAAQLAKEQARSQVLGSILGLAGMSGGMALGAQRASPQMAPPPQQNYQYEDAYASRPDGSGRSFGSVA